MTEQYIGWRAEMDRLWRQFMIHCEVIEEGKPGSPSDIPLTGMTSEQQDRVAGYVEGMKYAAKLIRRTVLHPKYDKEYPLFHDAPSIEDQIKDIDAVFDRVQDLENALNLALCKLSILEPGDSRAVSDEFVAMAAVAAGGDIVNDKSRELVREGLIRERLMDELPQETEKTNAETIRLIRNQFGVGLIEAKKIAEYVESGLCLNHTEAARYAYNLALAISVRPRFVETPLEAKQKWALARAKAGLPPFIGHDVPEVVFKTE